MTDTRAISTEGRIFVAQLTRDLSARVRIGADALSPGSTCWRDAFHKFTHALSKSDSPTKAARLFRAAVPRLRTAQRQSACYVNVDMSRSRSGLVEIMTYEVDKHPLTNTGYDGVVVRLYGCHLSRHGRITLTYGDKVAFLSWHALARMHERGAADILFANGMVAFCGFAGMLLRESRAHANTEINLADTTSMIFTGVLRFALEGASRYGFFDVLTVLPIDDDRPAMQKRIAQGNAVTRVVANYCRAHDADPRGHVDDIPVLPFRPTDYVSRALLRANNERQEQDASQ